MAKLSRACSLCFGILLTGLALPKGSAQSNSRSSGFRLEAQPSARFDFEGFVGNRIQAMVENWLLKAPSANPGMLEMFHVRDREPKPNLVPWAGEFVGKYLISAIQAQRLTQSAELNRTVREVVT